jgi:signal transduction histidine kinase
LVRRPAAWARAHPRLADALFAALLTALLLPGPWLYHSDGSSTANHRAPDVFAVLLILVQGVPLALRRSRPATVLLLCGTATLTYDLLGYGSGAGGVSLLVATYSVGAFAARPRTWPLLAFTVAIVSIDLFVAADEVQADAVLGNYLIFVTAFLLGDNLRTRRAYVSELEARAERAELDREALTRRAVAEERARIAREMHDVVAHSVSVMVVQSGAARRTTDPDKAHALAGQIETAGRQALTELRRLLGVLRGGESQTAPSLAPQPRLGQLENLLEHMRAAGLDCELTVTGRRRTLSPGVDLTAFRIVQEALTNCLKHAGPARASVSVDFGDRLLSLVVTDDGRGVVPAPASGHATLGGRSGGQSGGHGLIGMRERVAVFGGSLWAGPRRGGGYDVIAQLPLGREDEGPRIGPVDPVETGNTVDAVSGPAASLAGTSS